jgi:hypothetical protein
MCGLSRLTESANNLVKENDMEKKVLSVEEIEAQTLIELPDRPQTDNIITTIVIILFNLGGGGGGGAGGNSG